MVYHCTAYPNMVFTGQVLLLASSHVQRVKYKEITQGGDVHCTLGKFNHPIYLQRTGFKERNPNKQHLNLQTCWITRCLPPPLTCSYFVLERIIHKARIVKEGWGITFFARDYWYGRSWWFFGVNALWEFHLFATCNKNTSECNKGDMSSSVGKMCKICSKAKWQCGKL